VNDRLPGPLADPAPPSAAERASATPRQSVSSPGAAADGCRSGPSRPLAATSRDERSANLPGVERPRSLAELQAWLVCAITAETPLDPSGIVRPSASLIPSARLHIYRYAYRARLIECLRDDYPVLASSLGDAAFETLCHSYIAEHPSRSASLNDFGRDLPNLCAASAPLEARTFYRELAALEWALVEVTHAPLGSLALEALAGVPPEAWGRARLVPSEALRVLHFSYPVNAYYQQARTTDQTPELPGPSATATAVYRRGLGLWRMDLTPAMTRVLEALVAGATIGAALGQIGVDEADPDALAEAERSVMMWFREWVVGGFFAELVTD
jgi:hypothetical protein